MVYLRVTLYKSIKIFFVGNMIQNQQQFRLRQTILVEATEHRFTSFCQVPTPVNQLQKECIFKKIICMVLTRLIQTDAISIENHCNRNSKYHRNYPKLHLRTEKILLIGRDEISALCFIFFVYSSQKETDICILHLVTDVQLFPNRFRRQTPISMYRTVSVGVCSVVLAVLLLEAWLHVIIKVDGE